MKFKYVPSEIDYIVKYASILLQNEFSGIVDVSTDRDTMSNSTKESISEVFKSIHPDLIIFCVKGEEVGCGEKKPPGKGSELIDVDKDVVAVFQASSPESNPNSPLPVEGTGSKSSGPSLAHGHIR
ncbi:unnamed protein product [Mucor hiemalis]